MHRQPLGKFLNETLEKLSNFLSTQKISNQTLAELSFWTQSINEVLPETAMLANLKNAIILLNPDFQWNTYAEYKEQKMQNDDCFQTKVKIQKSN